jgi:hypothetical protein
MASTIIHSSSPVVRNLILLCQWHHTAVHEDGVTIADGSDGWVFTKPNGQPCQPWVGDQNLAWHLDFALRQQQQAQHDRLAGVDSFQYPDALTIQPRWAGEPVDLRHIKLYLPSDCPSRRQSSLINKPRSAVAVHLGDH